MAVSWLSILKEMWRFKKLYFVKYPNNFKRFKSYVYMWKLKVSVINKFKKKSECSKKLEWYAWVLVSLIYKVFDGWIRDPRFNSHLHQKSIGVLVGLIIKNYHQEWTLYIKTL